MSKVKNQTKDTMTYSDAMSRLEEIVDNIENNKYDIDLLTDKVKEAVELVEFCRNKLDKTSKNLEKIIPN